MTATGDRSQGTEVRGGGEASRSTLNPRPSTGTLACLIDAQGRLSFVWDDELASLLELGRATVKRASHVEPDRHGLWWVDLEPVQGPKIGPFRLRGDAITCERRWLEKHRG